MSLDQTCWIVVIQNLNFLVQNLQMSSRKMQRRHREWSRGIAWPCLSSALEGIWYSTPHAGHFVSGKEPRYPRYGTRSGPHFPSGLVWRKENLLLPLEFKPHNFQSAASRIDYAVLARSSMMGPVSIITIYGHLNKWFPILKTFLKSSNLMRRSVNSNLYVGCWEVPVFGTYCRWIIFWSRWI